MKLLQIMDRIKAIGEAKLYDSKNKIFLANSYSLEANNTISLERGWGMKVAEGANDTETMGSVSNYHSRSFELLFTAQNIGNAQSSAMVYDNSQRLLEDGFSLMDDLKGDKQLNSLVTSLNYISDDGISIFGGENGKEYLLFSLSLTVGYRKIINANC